MPRRPGESAANFEYRMRREQERRNRVQSQMTEQDKRDRAVLSVMKDWPLKPGQMLFLGPKSVAALTDGAYDPGRMTDKMVLDKSDWAVV